MTGYCRNHGAKNEHCGTKKKKTFAWLNRCPTKKRCRWHDQIHILEECYVTSMKQVCNVHADAARSSPAWQRLCIEACSENEGDVEKYKEWIMSDSAGQKCGLF